MNFKPLQLGIVGGAPHSAAGYAHVTASQMDHCWELKAGAFSRNKKINQLAGEQFGVASDRIYNDLEQMLKQESEKLDAVALLTPTPLHRDMVMQCLNAGMPIICEKALCLTSEEGEEILKKCADQKGFLSVIYNYSGYPMVRELRQLIRDGMLGELLHFQAEMPQEGFLRMDANGNKPGVQDWRQSDGPIPMLHLDLAVHLHELIHYLTGLKPLSVIADQTSRGWLNVVDHVTCLCRYSNDVQGQVWFSKCSLGHRNGLRLRLYGSKASAEWYQLNPEEIVLSFSDGTRKIHDRASNAVMATEQRYNRFKAGHPAGFIEALANLYMDIGEALSGYQKTGRVESDEVFGADLSIEGLRWLEAMVRSSETNTWELIK
ncbi:MAG: Gfo/Idh/MocA family oxidoreductase [Kiritimatiellae bacterium]|jgi:predicted dehydrogenase|nr:Gfo/Idh/MocA family oxidoreductase [Kiritimatiellia bacterium]